MDANDWLRVIETKLDLINCTNEACVTLAVDQLEGPAMSWWDSYYDSHQDPRTSLGTSSLEPFMSSTYPDRYSSRRPKNSVP
jgi:hypothetical protein